MIRTDVAKHKLGLACHPQPLEIGGYDGESKTTMVHPVEFVITSRDGSSRFQIKDAIAVDKLAAARNTKLSSELRETWTYLKGIELHEPSFEDVTVLVGEDNPAVHHYAECIVWLVLGMTGARSGSGKLFCWSHCHERASKVRH